MKMPKKNDNVVGLVTLILMVISVFTVLLFPNSEDIQKWVVLSSLLILLIVSSIFSDPNGPDYG